MGADDLLRVRRLDRWTIRWRLGRVWRRGLIERRATRLAIARGFEGACLDGARRQTGRLVADSELYLGGGSTLSLGQAHVPTFDHLASALQEGPVRLERVADHRRFFGLYFQTRQGPLAMLVNDLSIRLEGGGQVRSVAPLAFA